MIDSKRKGVKPDKVSSFEGPVESETESIPDFIFFRAAQKRNTVTLQWMLGLVVVAWVIQYSVDKVYDAGLIKQLRERRITLVPSNIVGFTPAKLQGIPESYVESAVTTFISLFGNVTPRTIEENFSVLESYMSPEISVRFRAESAEWVRTVKEEQISEILQPLQTEIIVADGGQYKASVKVLRDRYVKNEYFGQAKERVTMRLRLMAPTVEKQWHLRITHFTRESIN